MATENVSTSSHIHTIRKPFTVNQLESKLEELKHLNNLVLAGVDSPIDGQQESAKYIAYLVQSKLEDLHAHYEQLSYITMGRDVAAMEASV